MSLGTAFKAFFAALSNEQTSDALRRVLDQAASPPSTATPAAGGPERPLPEAAPSSKPSITRSAASPRSDAVSLLAMLQRESRLVDLVQEPLEQFTDAQVGAAARPCLKQCQQTLKRVFDLRPMVSHSEGETIAIPPDASPVRYQKIGEGSGAIGATGRLVHPGWIATKCELAQWTGEAADANIVAPAQIEA